ncbi:MAG: TetR/AcrR family transcriptional regulator [Gammaproteobacteria bacterium]|nr:TetR/AcrR family transcriptional regulator [Gammaproteobacteria bacterium]
MAKKKRKRLTAEERRDLIVRQAIALFARQGFRATRVKDIADTVGTSDALVFQHFPTKRELYDAILEHLCARKHFTEVEQLLYYAPEYDVEEVLTRLSAWVLEQTEAEAAWLRLILYAALERDEATAELTEEHFGRIIDYVAYEIAEGQAAGRFRSGDPKTYARSFFAGLLGLSVMRTVVRDPDFANDGARATAATHVTLFLKGLQAGKGEKP